MSPLHHFGNFCRELLLGIPLSTARILFLAPLLALFLWVLLLPRDQTTPPQPSNHFGDNLKLWALLALLIQIAIYSFL